MVGALDESGASCLGRVAPGGTCSDPARLMRGSVPRTRRTLVSAARASANPLGERAQAQCFRGLRRARQPSRSTRSTAGLDFCDLGAPRPAGRSAPSVDQPGGARACPTASTRPTSVGPRQVVAAGPATRSPSIRTAPASMSRRAALVLAARPPATSTAGRCTGSPAGSAHSGASVGHLAALEHRVEALLGRVAPRPRRGRARRPRGPSRRLARLAAAPPAATSASSSSTSRGCRAVHSRAYSADHGVRDAHQLAELLGGRLGDARCSCRATCPSSRRRRCRRAAARSARPAAPGRGSAAARGRPGC